MFFLRYIINNGLISVKKKMKKYLNLTSMIFIVLVLSACHNRDGNHYVFSYNPSSREATLIEGEEQYKGVAMIPSTVNYEGIEYSVTEIGDDAFHGCAELTSATLPTSIKKIGSHAFAQSGLSTIDIPNSEIKIGDYAFVDTPWFTSHPDGMIYISNTAFRYKGEMPEGTDFIFKDGITDISEWAFEGCRGLNSISIPSGVSTIKDYVFVDCDSLRHITIPNSVTSIGVLSFYMCSGLESINIPSSVREIEQKAFLLCSKLKCFNVDEANPSYCDIDGVLYSKDTSVLELVPGGMEQLIISNKVKKIAPFAASFCFRLTSVLIPNSVTEIGEEAFSCCYSLPSVVIPNSVTEIGKSAFSGCRSLTSVVLPNRITMIPKDAFSSCRNLTSIVIPQSVNTIGENAFGNCWNLTSIEIPNSVSTIGASAFGNCSKITSIKIPNNVSSIGEEAFGGCSLTDVYLHQDYPSEILNERSGIDRSKVTLHVPIGSEEIFRKFGYYYEFNSIVGEE